MNLKSKKMMKTTVLLMILGALLSSVAHAQFYFTEISSRDDDLLLNTLKKELRENTFPYLSYSKGRSEFCAYSYFTQEEARNIFAQPCDHCGKLFVSAEVIDQYYSDSCPPAMTDAETRGRSEMVLKLQKQRPPYFTPEQGLEILSLAFKLGQSVPLSHRILFLGRSGYWIYEALKLIESQLDPSQRHLVIQANFSGKPNSPTMAETDSYHQFLASIVTPERRAFYQSYLQSIGLDFRNHASPLVIVDFMETGEGLLSFLKLYTRYTQDEGVPNPDLSVIDLGDLSYSSPRISQSHRRLQATPDGKSEFWFDERGDFRIDYYSLGIYPRNPLLSLLVNAQDHYIPAPYYPAFRWKEEFNRERDEIRYPAALQTQKELHQIWEDSLRLRGLSDPLPTATYRKPVSRLRPRPRPLLQFSAQPSPLMNLGSEPRYPFNLDEPPFPLPLQDESLSNKVMPLPAEPTDGLTRPPLDSLDFSQTVPSFEVGTSRMNSEIPLPTHFSQPDPFSLLQNTPAVPGMTLNLDPAPINPNGGAPLSLGGYPSLSTPLSPSSYASPVYLSTPLSTPAVSPLPTFVAPYQRPGYVLVPIFTPVPLYMPFPFSLFP